MARFLRPFGLSLLLFVTVVTAPLPRSEAQTQSDLKREKSLRKKLAAAEKKVERAQKRLARAKTAWQKEYKQAADKKTRSQLAGLLDAVRAKYVEALGASGRLDRKQAASLTKDVRSALSQSIGPNLARYLAAPLRDEMVATMTDGKYSSIKVVGNCLEDAFSGDFEQDFATEISRSIDRRLPGLVAKRDKIKRDLDEHLEGIRARQSGLPYGMVRVEGGRYGIGIDPKELKPFSKLVKYKLHQVALYLLSTPAHTVKLDPFLIDRNEITCAEYAEFLKDTGHKGIPKYWRHEFWPNRPEAKKDPKGWSIPKDWENRPVTYVSHHDAKSFCTWVGRRLPTEFEWEAAARWGQTRKRRYYWSWGDTPPKRDHCNYDVLFDHPLRQGLSYIKVKVIPPVVPVGMFPEGRNPGLGLNDMSGNAYEITSSPFKPYPGFKMAKVGGRTVSEVDFDQDQFVVRGGCGNNKASIVTTIWRRGLGRNNRAAYVGFRTAATPIRGKDHLDSIFESGEYNRFLVDYLPLGSDLLDGRKHAVLELQDQARFSAIMAGGWNPKTKLPERARFVCIANRKANDFRNHQALNGLEGEGGQPILLGFLQTDLRFKNPDLVPGEYLVLWKPKHEEEIVDPDAGTSEEPAAAGKDGDKPGKKTGKKPKKGKKGKKGKKEKAVPTRTVPDSVWFYNIRKSKAEIVKFPMDGFPPTVSIAQPTSIRNDKDENTVRLIYSFPIRRKKKQCFVLTIPLETEPGVARDYK